MIQTSYTQQKERKITWFEIILHHMIHSRESISMRLLTEVSASWADWYKTTQPTGKNTNMTHCIV